MICKLHVPQAESYPPLKENLEADVVIVGAGMFGLHIAYNLCKAGKKVVVLEGRSKGAARPAGAPLLPVHAEHHKSLHFVGYKAAHIVTATASTGRPRT